MTYIRFLVVVLCLWSTQLLAVTGNINVQFLLSNADTGTMEGQYKITFSLLLDEKHSKDDALWKETHDVFITQGKVSRILGEKLPLIIMTLNLMKCTLNWTLKSWKTLSQFL